MSIEPVMAGALALPNPNADLGGVPSPGDAPNVRSSQTADGGPSQSAQNKYLTKDQKAAVIVRLLDSDPDELPLAELEAENMAQLVRAMARLTYVDEQTILQIVQEFLTDIDSLAIHFKPGLDAARQSLQSHISDEVTAILGTARDKDAPPDPWITVATLDTADIAEILSKQSPQVAAIVLAKLPPVAAAEILDAFEPDLARAATLAASVAGRVENQVIFEIGSSIVGLATTQQDQGALVGDPVERVGAILNFTPGSAREDLLGNLEKSDSDLADRVRRIMFTFADIPDRVEMTDIPKLVRSVDNATLVKALAGGQDTEKEAVEFIFANLSKRLAEQLTEEVAEMGDIKSKDADAAMNAVIQGIREMEKAGEMTLISPEEG